MNFKLSEAVSVLERTPAVLRSLLEHQHGIWTHNNEGPDTWSPYDVLGHLLHGEKADWIPRLRIVMADEGNKTFTPFDRFAQFENSKGKSLENLLDEFEAARKANLKVLKESGIQDADLGRTAIHPALGTVTLENLLAAWTVHDLGHIAQIARVMAKQWKAEVGPWVEYMGVLNR